MRSKSKETAFVVVAGFRSPSVTSPDHQGEFATGGVTFAAIKEGNNLSFNKSFT
jgi:hypothetical protein